MTGYLPNICIAYGTLIQHVDGNFVCRVRSHTSEWRKTSAVDMAILTHAAAVQRHHGGLVAHPAIHPCDGRRARVHDRPIETAFAAWMHKHWILEQLFSVAVSGLLPQCFLHFPRVVGGQQCSILAGGNIIPLASVQKMFCRKSQMDWIASGL